MVYLIDARIKYRTEDGAIWLVADESTTIVLTVTMNRLLSFLIQRRGAVVSRDDIFENVWDAYGLRSSNNTLNKYISELRKILSGFGLSDGGISTVPRIGLMLSNGLDIQEIEFDENRLVSEDTGDEKELTQASQVKDKSRSTTCIFMSALGIFTLAISIAAFYYSPEAKQQSIRQDIATHLLFNFNGCPVYTMQKKSEAFSSQKIVIFNEIASSRKIDCHPGTIFLFQPSSAFVYGHDGRVFLSRCTINEEKKEDFASCLSFYWSSHAI